MCMELRMADELPVSVSVVECPDANCVESGDVVVRRRGRDERKRVTVLTNSEREILHIITGPFLDNERPIMGNSKSFSI